MDDIERRLLTLELETRHERELQDFRYDDLSHRLQVLEKNPITVSSTLKLLAAIALPLGVWLITGDLRKALAVARLGGG